MDNPPTYRTVVNRCKELALEITPNLPTTDSLEEWEAFQGDCEGLQEDHCSEVYESVENTDWAIYTHFGWKILHVLPQSEIDAAELGFLELSGNSTLDESCGGCFDIWTLQSSIASFALVNLVNEALDTLLEELIDLAETQICNLEVE